MPRSAVFFQGQTPAIQIGFAFCLGLLYFLCATIGQRFLTRQRSTKHVVESYSRLDLSGLNPLWIAIAAGLGEELFFRGALQPLFGIWITSLIFVLAHARAYRFDGLNQRVLLQCATLFAISCFFGLIAEHIGLLAAIGSHITVDVVGLYFVRQAVTQRGAA